MTLLVVSPPSRRRHLTDRVLTSQPSPRPRARSFASEPPLQITHIRPTTVLTTVTVQRLFDWCPDARGDLVTSQPEAASELRGEWFNELARNPTAAQTMSHWLAHPNEVRRGNER